MRTTFGDKAIKQPVDNLELFTQILQKLDVVKRLGGKRGEELWTSLWTMWIVNVFARNE